MADETGSKIMTAKEAVARFVKDGDEVITGNYNEAMPMSLLFEIIRQRKKGLTYYSQSGSFDAEFMVYSGSVDKTISAFMYKWGGKDRGGVIERFQREGNVLVEDYTNFTYNARLAAGAYGYSYMPVLPAIMDSDVFKIRGFMGEKKFGITQCPFTGREIPVVPAANPDVCVLHVQRADKNGNAQHWGGLGSTVHACLASRTIIVSCEELVESDVIKSSPHHTIVPGFRVSAVVEEPFGCHPFEILGFRGLDTAMFSLINQAFKQDNAMDAFFDEWIYGLPDRNAYIKHYIEVFGQTMLNRYHARSYYSAPANYGIAFQSGWDNNGISNDLGVDMEGLERLIAEKGELIDVN